MNDIVGDPSVSRIEESRPIVENDDLLRWFLLAVLITSAACAGLDPGTDSFGVYFDTAGNTNCATAAAFDAVTAYLLLMNPAGPTEAFECSVSMSGAPYMILSTVAGGSCLCWDRAAATAGRTSSSTAARTTFR